MARAKKTESKTTVKAGVKKTPAIVSPKPEAAKEAAFVEEPIPAIEPTRTVVSNTVIVALNNPTGISFDLAGNRTVTLNGNAENLRGLDKGHIPAGAFGLTAIDRADWDEIKAKYGHMRLFKSGLCFAANSSSAAEAEAKERRDTRHGREAIDPKTDPQLRGRIKETEAPAE